MQGFYTPDSNEPAGREGIDEVLSPASIPPESPAVDEALGALNSSWSAQRRAKTGGREAGVPNQRARFDLAMSARVYGLRALATLVEVMENPKEPALTRMAAANNILDRGFGKPVQCTQVSAPDGGPVQSKLTIEFIGTPSGSLRSPIQPQSNVGRTISPPSAATLESALADMDLFDNPPNTSHSNVVNSLSSASPDGSSVGGVSAEVLDAVVRSLPTFKPPWEQ